MKIRGVRESGKRRQASRTTLAFGLALFSCASGAAADQAGIKPSTPRAVLGLDSAAVAVAAGDGHTCALMKNASMLCWGSNSKGELGNGTTAMSPRAVPVVGLPSEVSAIAAGRGHTCAMTRSGEVWCWGFNSLGQLGNGHRSWANAVPERVKDLSGPAIAIAAGAVHTCALMAAGSVECWGDMSFSGDRGIRTTIQSNAPAIVAGLPEHIVGIAAGDLHNCALSGTSGVYCWGQNLYGQLGDGSTDDNARPVRVVGLSSNVAGIVAGGSQSCALAESGEVSCWGERFNGLDGEDYKMVTAQGVGAVRSRAIAAGGKHSCAIGRTGTLQCWGQNSHGDLGIDEGIPGSAQPFAIKGLPFDAKQIALGAEHTCAITHRDAVVCWGFNGTGQLGDGHSTPIPSECCVAPASVAPEPEK